VRTPLNGTPKRTRPFLRHPTFHLLVVALARVFLWSLTGPVQTLFQQCACMLQVMLDAKVLFDKDHHTLSSPQLVSPTMCRRSLPRQGSQLQVGPPAWSPEPPKRRTPPESNPPREMRVLSLPFSILLAGRSRSAARSLTSLRGRDPGCSLITDNSDAKWQLYPPWVQNVKGRRWPRGDGRQSLCGPLPYCDILVCHRREYTALSRFAPVPDHDS